MNKPYQLVVFDWEGTISDTLGCILHTVADEAKALGFSPVDPREARKYVDLGLIKALRRLYPQASLVQQDQLVQAVQKAMFSKSSDVWLIPGAVSFIKQLHDAKVDLAIATNKGHPSLVRSLQATGLDEYFKVTRSASQVPAKPCPQMLQEIMDEFGADAFSTLMIGDSITDMEMASYLGVPALGVDFYHQQASALKSAGAIAVFDDYALLANYLQLPKRS